MNLERVSGIYAIVSPSGARYVGSAVRIAHRWRCHRSDLTLGKHHSHCLTRAHRKYGLDALRFEVLEVCDKAELLAREQFHIDATPRHKRYNSQLVASSSLGYKHTAEARANMSKAHMGHKRSPEANAKITAYQRGKFVSEETRRRMSAAKTGFRHSEETLARLRAVRAAYLADPTNPKLQHIAETRERIGAKNSARLNTSGYRGVHYHKGAQKWMARAPGGKYLGLFDTAEAGNEARTAYLASVTLPATAPEPTP